MTENNCKHENKMYKTDSLLLSKPPQMKWKCYDCGEIGYSNGINNVKIEDLEPFKKQEGKYELTKEQLMKLLTCLQHSVFPNKEYDVYTRHQLINLNEDLSWDIAEMFDYDLNEGTINPHTLEFEKFKF